jgi:hypothetical protein
MLIQFLIIICCQLAYIHRSVSTRPDQGPVQNGSLMSFSSPGAQHPAVGLTRTAPVPPLLLNKLEESVTAATASSIRLLESRLHEQLAVLSDFSTQLDTAERGVSALATSREVAVFCASRPSPDQALGVIASVETELAEEVRASRATRTDLRRAMALKCSAADLRDTAAAIKDVAAAAAVLWTLRQRQRRRRDRRVLGPSGEWAAAALAGARAAGDPLLLPAADLSTTGTPVGGSPRNAAPTAAAAAAGASVAAAAAALAVESGDDTSAAAAAGGQATLLLGATTPFSGPPPRMRMSRVHSPPPLAVDATAAAAAAAAAAAPPGSLAAVIDPTGAAAAAAAATAAETAALAASASGDASVFLALHCATPSPPSSPTLAPRPHAPLDSSPQPSRPPSRPQ